MTGRLPSKVIPGAQGSSASATRPSTVLHNFAYAYHQSAQYGPHDLLACVNSGGDGATILIYDMNSVQLVQTLTSGVAPSCNITCVQWLPPAHSFMQHGVFLISGNERGELLYWDVTAGVPLQRLVIPCRQPVHMLQLLGAERILVVTNTASTYVYHTHLVDPTPLAAKASELPLRSSPGPTSAPSGTSPAASAVANLASASRRALESSLKMPFTNLTSGSPTAGSSMAAAGSSSSAFDAVGSYTMPFFPPQHWVTSKLASVPVCAVTLGDRVRLITPFDDDPDDTQAGVGSSSSNMEHNSSKPTARDVVYDADDGEPTVIDIFFSQAQEEVLYFATRNSIGTYDWRLGTILNEQLVWMQHGGVEFRRIFPSSMPVVSLDRPHRTASTRASTPALPLLYSFGSDQRLVAWYLLRAEKFSTVAADVRGARITSKSVAQVLQSPSNPTRFAIVFEDSTVADWRYCLRTQRWRQEGVCTFALSRPLSACRMAPHCACYALDSGHLVLVDVLHNQTLRKLSVVYSGGTKMIATCQDRWMDLVWVVTHRMEDSRHHHQVSLLDARSGEIVRVLRKPSDKADLVRIKEVTMDPGQQYLLLSFWNGTFEVWNAGESRLLHIYTGLGVACVSWAPATMCRCLSGVQGQPQILAVLFSDGTLSFWSVYKDRVVVSRDAVPLFPSNAIAGGSARGCAVGERFVVFDSNGSGMSLQYDGKLVAKRFKELPIQGSGSVISVESSVSASDSADGGGFGRKDSMHGASWTSGSSGARSVTSLHCDPSPGDSATAVVSRFPLSESARRATTDAGQRDAATLSATAGPVAKAAPAVSVVFEDHTFGVWDVATGECVAYSRSTAAARLLEATQAFWLEGSLIVVSTDGTTYVMDRTLTHLNSSIRSKALRRPMQTMAFLLPAQRTSLQASLLLLDDAQDALASTQHDANRGNRLIESLTGEEGAEDDAAPASTLVSSVSMRRRPCRGPLGQVIDESVTTQAQELQLYRGSMVPRRAAAYLAATAPTSDGRPSASQCRDGPTRALAVASLFGQAERQRFWAEAVAYAAIVDAAPSPAPSALASTTVTPYLLADTLSPSLATASVSRDNHLKLCEQRVVALTRHRDRNVDDSKSRLLVARRLLQLGEPAKAVELLLDANYQSSSFNALATLSIAIAGRAGSASASSPASAVLLSKAATRAAALLLAQGDVDGAVEKFVVAGDFAEACTAFQARGQWASAALLAKWAPPATSAETPSNTLVYEVLTRWAKYCERQRRVLPAARVMLSLGALHETLEVLRGHAPTADVAGLFALWVSEVLLMPRQVWTKAVTTRCVHAVPSPSSDGEDAQEAVDAEAWDALRSATLSVLVDFAGVLNSVGNTACEAAVLRHVARLKSALPPAYRVEDAAPGDG